MKNLILLRGLPGSGKSTLAQKFKDLGYEHLEADQYFINKDGGYEFNRDLLGDAHKWCQETADIFMDYGHSLVVSNTFTTEKELQPYLDLADKYDYLVTSLIVERRHLGINLHGVPQETIDKMGQRLKQNIKLLNQVNLNMKFTNGINSKFRTII